MNRFIVVTQGRKQYIMLADLWIKWDHKNGSRWATTIEGRHRVNGFRLLNEHCLYWITRLS